jgi:hypothetical protein
MLAGGRTRVALLFIARFALRKDRTSDSDLLLMT